MCYIKNYIHDAQHFTYSFQVFLIYLIAQKYWNVENVVEVEIA